MVFYSIFNFNYILQELSDSLKHISKMAGQAQLIFDEYGQPFIVMREQDKQKRLTGVEAIKVEFALNYSHFDRFLSKILSFKH